MCRAYGCCYCSANCASMGTIWRGHGCFLDKNVSATDPREDQDASLNAQEKAAVNIARKACVVPTAIETEDIALLAHNFSAKEEEAVVNCFVVMGYLNTFM